MHSCFYNLVTYYASKVINIYFIFSCGTGVVDMCFICTLFINIDDFSNLLFNTLVNIVIDKVLMLNLKN